MNKIIFLDVDGVLNNIETNAKTPNGFTGVMDSKVKLLSSLVQATGADVVLTSDWRLVEDADYDYLIKKLRYHGNIKIAGKTPDLGWENRGKEIMAYLDGHPADLWVVLDDNIFDDFNLVKDHLIITDPDDGLTEGNILRAQKMLNPIDGYAPGDILHTIFGDAIFIDEPIYDCYQVRMCEWDNDQIERMGGIDEAWVLIGSDQLLTDRNYNDIN